jgi:hypothetical protein
MMTEIMNPKTGFIFHAVLKFYTYTQEFMWRAVHSEYLQ